ncbi:MAG: ABC transporter permease [Candidatus Hydrogenedens sp.]|nr:ABC transporter permease [Candidatus Hydrogenedentota bacterium]NLF59039.1 ABC transporter permease [Candidatus Hydrogenedens sp.]
MGETMDIGLLPLAAGYALLLFPLAVMLWTRVPMVGGMLMSVARMTVQLLLVGLYLEFVFRWNNFWLNAAWLVFMIAVADASILRGCVLKTLRFAGPLFLALLAGTAIPLGVFLWVLLDSPHWIDARFAIPIGGMILGNCMRADIVGINQFYDTLRRNEKPYLLALSQGARRGEAAQPYLRDAIQAALAPTLATMATIGVVSLPGMMTGVILGGADPFVAIKYQMAIMIAIFSGTAITVWLAVMLSLGRAFDAWGVIRGDSFSK